MKITDEMVDAAYEAIRDGATPVEVVAALAPLIIEECAKVADIGINGGEGCHCMAIPEAIRDLKETS